MNGDPFVVVVVVVVATARSGFYSFANKEGAAIQAEHECVPIPSGQHSHRCGPAACNFGIITFASAHARFPTEMLIFMMQQLDERKIMIIILK